MNLHRPSLLLLLLLISVALLPLLTSSRNLPPKQQPTGGALPQSKGRNATAPPRQPRQGANGTAAAGNRTKGGHPHKGHHRGNGTVAGGPKKGNGTGAGQPKRNGNGTPNSSQTSPKPTSGNPKNGGQKNGNGGRSGGAQTNKNGGGTSQPKSNGQRRPKQIAEEENCSSKTSWPEVVGMTGEKARDYIQTTMPQCNWDVRIIPSNGFATMDYRPNRIRVFVDKQGVVRVPPRIG
ncbi:hypothetical protein CLOM_g12951 [Closterium sp. NIES-68]|nr:hypothetical protein CLOM_g23314 [Closterium sp. NIES-68]GJP53817.1 hypothetical protein CLOM_g12951 [Closterium sp. NIES-68]GJP58701.1 hypothetical protein CLOP_g2642 [Closterium sp. NIES-67]